MMTNIVVRGMDALDAACKALKMPYHIKRSFKKYGAHIQSCTINLPVKSFTKRGDNCVEEVLKEAVLYLVNSYTIFNKVRNENEKEQLSEEQLIMGLS